MIVTLKSNSATVKIDSKGAELISFQNSEGIEYMWQKDPKYWNRCSPVLFPIVGNLRDNKTIINKKEYSIAKHGFCRDADFTISNQTETTVSFTYTYNEETLAVYPYQFSLTLNYKLIEAKLEILYTVENMDKQPIDFCLGAHPAFNVPLNSNETFEDYCLAFNKAEPQGSAVYDLEKLEINVDNRVHLLNEENKIMLKYHYFDEDAVIFDTIHSDSVKLYSTKSGHGVQVDFNEFDAIAFWTPTKMDAPFLCIEPWNGMSVCSDEDNHYTSKRGIKHLEVAEKKDFKLIITTI